MYTYMCARQPPDSPPQGRDGPAASPMPPPEGWSSRQPSPPPEGMGQEIQPAADSRASHETITYVTPDDHTSAWSSRNHYARKATRPQAGAARTKPVYT